ncbi:MAG: MotA/TolQ/ExbB proton channel family protein [Flavobacteriales bacterium]|jgi:biopolymer transport protein ExbB|nr:MotA/TolQ/ExbB proton channel family protein [Flavobacteriales bacterium]NCG29087.1 MotA/TolQ/ExbB proton channel family protein [Bacteroidota bacterium]MBT3964113.1 MotA/TolQ/ExbB proton channel family protein [Flavobacteriales bacterium]MBT4705942.1 MotA/TolQ/ExbB proton channel family protein [Flavobacteriales bacterium]MBT4931536.1 MotA/TolQ/ExbB proton channel family protein [Flavobacteriales bacterium]
MKRIFLSIAIAVAMMVSGIALAQDDSAAAADDSTAQEEMMADSAPEAAPEPEAVEPAAEMDIEEVAPEEDRSLHQVIKAKFIEGGPEFMSFVLICLILGLAMSIERILYLNMATTNNKKLLEDIDEALKSGGVEAAQEVCRNTRGPVASIFYQGLDRADHGIEMVEKSVISYGSVQMGLLEKGLSWISLFIALAPMLGFFGTVIGMISAFDAIAAANNISPGIVAGGIGVALITTVSGLLVAMILQIFYNYIVAKVDSIVNEMEDASISLVDLLIEHKLNK